MKKFLVFIVFAFVLISVHSQAKRDSLVVLLKQNINDTIRINTLCELSSRNITNNIDQRLFWLFEALTIADNNNLSEKSALVNMLIGRTYMENSDSLNGFKYFKYADKYYKEKGSNQEQVMMMLNYGFAYASLNCNDKGIEYYYKALVITDEDEKKAHIYCLLGSSYIYLGDYELALKNLFKGSVLAEKTGSQIILTEINMNLGGIYYILKDYDKALTYFTSAAEEKQKIGDTESLVVLYHNIGSLLCSLKKNDEATAVFQKALLLAKEIDDKQSISAILGQLGVVSADKGDNEKAIAFFKEAISNDVANKNPSLYSNLGQAYQDTGNYDLAIANYKKGIDIAVEKKQLESVKNIAKKISYYYRNKRDYKKSLEFQDVYLEMKDSLLNEQIVNRINEVQNKHKYEKQANKILVLEKENEIKELRLSRKNSQIILLILGSFLFVSVIILLIQRYKYIKKRSSILILQQEKIHLQEKELLELEQKNLESQLNKKNNELASHIMQVSEKNSFFEQMIQKLLDLSKYLKKENQNKLDNLISELRANTQNDIWQEFDIRFTEIQQDFYEKLNSKHPDLSTAERRLCAFLRMNMTSKEIANITHQSPGSIDTARSRLRKKLNITDPNINLNTFISNI